MQETSEIIWLLGQPQLEDYLRFVASKVIGGADRSRRELVDSWRAANDTYYELERAGAPEIAEQVWRALPDELSRAAAAIAATPWYRASFGALPSAIVAIDLERVIVSQTHIEPGAALRRLAGSAPLDDAALFDFCLPAGGDLPPVAVTRLGEGHYRFTSPSTDLRAHDLRLLGGDALASANGPVHSVIALPIGFGCNWISGIRSAGRVVLQNGHNRAYALLATGRRHAYAIVEDVTRKDELRLATSTGIDASFFFAAARPPLLRDYLDPRFATHLRTKPIDCEIEVEVRVRDRNVTRETSPEEARSR